MKTMFVMLSLLGTLVLLNACQEETIDTKTDAIITGIDMSLCACCGGYMITLTDDPEKYSEEYFQWDPSQEQLTLIDGEAFPIYVKIKYEVDTTRCSFANSWINISELKVVN